MKLMNIKIKNYVNELTVIPFQLICHKILTEQ